MTAPARCRDGRCARMTAAGLCRPCADRVGRWLGELPRYVAAVADQLAVDVPCCDKHAAPPTRNALGARLVKRGVPYEPTHPNPVHAGAVPAPGNGPRVSGSPERPLPGGADRLSWLSCAGQTSYWAGSDDWEYQAGRPPVAAMLASWCRMIAEELGDHTPQAGRVVPGPGGQPVRRTSGADVPVLVDWLTRRHGRIVERAWADDYAGEVHGLWSTARRMAGEAERWVPIGACIRVMDDGAPCGEALSARPGAAVIRCPACGADWGRELWLILGAAMEEISG